MAKAACIIPVKLVPIGNSRGVRLPKPVIQKYGYDDTLFLEETEKGLLIRGQKRKKLSWAQTFEAMAKEREKWDDLEAAVGDGLDKEDF